jgi:hypothetical protein
MNLQIIIYFNNLIETKTITAQDCHLERCFFESLDKTKVLAMHPVCFDLQY